MKLVLHLIAVEVLLILHGSVFSPALWRQGSSSAFELNIFLWVAIAAWFGVAVFLVYQKIKPKVPQLPNV